MTRLMGWPHLALVMLKGQRGGQSADRNYQNTLVRYCTEGPLSFNNEFKDVTLGLSIEPAQVRLITSKDDPYCWKILPGKEHLFQKQLSKHSIGAYMELFREVGASFEAVLAISETSGQEQSSDGNITFSKKIAELERDKSALTEELCQWKFRTERAEKDLDQLRITVYTLSQQDTHKMALINYFRNVTKALQETNIAFEALGF